MRIADSKHVASTTALLGHALVLIVLEAVALADDGRALQLIWPKDGLRLSRGKGCGEGLLVDPRALRLQHLILAAEALRAAAELAGHAADPQIKVEVLPDTYVLDVVGVRDHVQVHDDRLVDMPARIRFARGNWRAAEAIEADHAEFVQVRLVGIGFAKVGSLKVLEDLAQRQIFLRAELVLRIRLEGVLPALEELILKIHWNGFPRAHVVIHHEGKVELTWAK
mmetsp:Transcript_8818/g.26104  ORF Transcript_8818/g.26104 Transcript_8818/m.26104 type:complete len:224 (-) Transcript_8818:669-1340(-)